MNKLENERLAESINLIDKKDSSSTNENSFNDHHLEEYPIDLNLERKYLDTYAYYFSNPNHSIDLKGYKISDGERTKNLISDLQNKVVYQSESTDESKLIDYKQDLNYIMNSKSTSNKMLENGETEMAIAEYKKIIKMIDKIEREISSLTKIEDKYLNDIFLQKKLIYSNLAMAYSKKHMFRESAEYDKRIIEEIDSNFDKSYARLVNSYIEMGNLNLALRYGNILKNNFSAETKQKYSSILNKLEQEEKKNDLVNIF
jgi:hypothetical protein